MWQRRLPRRRQRCRTPSRVKKHTLSEKMMSARGLWNLASTAEKTKTLMTFIDREKRGGKGGARSENEREGWGDDSTHGCRGTATELQ